jgi:hypothetical protein
LKLALNVNHIHADATYKLIWQGYPVLVVGTTDKIIQFHPFGLCICSNEQTADFVFLFEALKLGTAKVFNNQICPNTIVCDASPAIQNAFKQVFGEESVIVMCWFHMKKNVQKKAEQLVHPKSDVAKIINDIDILQLSKTEDIFEKASHFFIEKWKERWKFVAYFKKGVLNVVPCTNNALEAFNRVIEDENTLRERFSLGQFSAMLMQYMETWSNNCEANVKIMHDQPVVDLPLWTAAYQWAKLEKTIITENTTDCQIFYSPAKDKRDLTDNDMEINKEMKFNSFNEYKVAMFNIWTTTLPTKRNGQMGNPTVLRISKKEFVSMLLGWLYGRKLLYHRRKLKRSLLVQRGVGDVRLKQKKP